MKPDFSTYTITELHDVIEHIDREKYPERLIAAQTALAQKMESDTPEDERQESLKLDKDKQLIALVICAVFTITSLYFLYKAIVDQTVLTRSAGVMHYDQSPLLFWFHVVMYIIGLIGFSFWGYKTYRKNYNET